MARAAVNATPVDGRCRLLNAGATPGSAVEPAHRWSPNRVRGKVTRMINEKGRDSR
jgi:hypothetical protein